MGPQFSLALDGRLFPQADRLRATRYRRQGKRKNREVKGDLHLLATTPKAPVKAKDFDKKVKTSMV